MPYVNVYRVTRGPDLVEVETPVMSKEAPDLATAHSEAHRLEHRLKMDSHLLDHLTHSTRVRVEDEPCEI